MILSEKAKLRSIQFKGDLGLLFLFILKINNEFIVPMMLYKRIMVTCWSFRMTKIMLPFRNVPKMQMMDK